MNSRLLMLALSLLPSFVFAQGEDDVDVGASMPGVNVNIRVKGSGKDSVAEATRHEEQKGEGYRIVWDTDPTSSMP